MGYVGSNRRGVYTLCKVPCRVLVYVNSTYDIQRQPDKARDDNECGHK